jgi:outer membrane cobalamin receptor
MLGKMSVKNVKRGILLSLLFVLVFFIDGKAQDKTHRIEGEVYTDSGMPVEFVTVKLLDAADSTLITAMYADEKGVFKFDNVICDKAYLLKLSNIGFKTLYLHEAINKNCNAKDFGRLLLEMDVTLNLEEVKVQANIDVLKAGIDKKIYNVGQDISVRGGTANDVLNRLPSVEVDEDGGVTLRGDGSVIILINGRPSSLSGGNGKTLLDALPAGSIERVEIVANPSAKYDPDGTSGIINIVLKKSLFKGLNGAVSSNAGSGDFAIGNIFEGNVSLNYRNNKFNIYSSYNGRTYSGFRNKFSDIYEYFAGDSSVRLNQSRLGTDLNNSQSLRTGIDLNLSERHKLGLFGNLSLGRRERRGALWNTLYEFSENPSTLWRRSSFDPKTRTNIDLGLNYEWSFKEERGKLQLNINQSFGDEDIKGFYSEAYFTTDTTLNGEDTLVQQLQNIESNNINTIQLDFEFVFPEINSRIEFGAKSIIRDQSVQTYSETFDSQNGIFNADTLANFNYQYDERIFSLYGIFGQQVEKFKYQVGLRVEQAYQIPELLSTGESIPNDYFNLFPSAHLKYAVNDQNEFGLSYSRRISRARAGQLNPFTNYADPFNLRRGNPYLRPEYIHSFDLAYTFERKKLSISSSLYYRRSEGVITRIKEFYDDNTSAITYQNLSSTNAMGAEFVFMFKPYPFWRTTASFNGNLVEYYTDLQGLSNTTGAYLKAKFNTVLDFWKKTASFQASYGYNGPRVMVQGTVQRKGTFDLAFEKKFLEGNMALGLRVSDLFNQQSFYMDALRDNFQQIAYYKWMSRRVFLTFSYKFGKIEFKNKSTSQMNSPG